MIVVWGFLLILVGIYAWLTSSQAKMGKYAFRGQRGQKLIADIYPTETLTYKTSKQPNSRIKIIFVPGNPGYVEFYDTFLHELFVMLGQKVEIEIVSHAGHTREKATVQSQQKLFNLEEQIDHKKAYLEQLLSNFEGNIILVGHSIGTYMILKVLQRLKNPERILRVYQLFPTIMRMRKSPNGNRLRFLFNDFTSKHYSKIVKFITHLPSPITFGITKLMIGRQLLTTELYRTIQGFLNPNQIHQLLYLANQEMQLVDRLDEQSFSYSAKKCFYYFSENDAWCPKVYVSELILKIQKQTHSSENYEIDKLGLNHAFVLGGSQKMASFLSRQIKKII